MARKELLWSLSSKLDKLDIKLILIHISDAHTDLWPLGLNYQPAPQKDFKDRLHRANEFVNKHECPYTVLVDSFENEFERTYHAWPDKFFLIDTETELVLQTSVYGKDALLLNDYAKMIAEARS